MPRRPEPSDYYAGGPIMGSRADDPTMHDYEQEFYCAEGCKSVREHQDHIARLAPTERGMCEVITRYDVREGVAGYIPTFCESRETTKYVDVWGAEHWVCNQPGHETRLKSQWPEAIQRQLYEDVSRQASLFAGRGPIGGSVRPDAPVTDDSDYKAFKPHKFDQWPGRPRGLCRCGKMEPHHVHHFRRL